MNAGDIRMIVDSPRSRKWGGKMSENQQQENANRNIEDYNDK